MRHSTWHLGKKLRQGFLITRILSNPEDQVADQVQEERRLRIVEQCNGADEGLNVVVEHAKSSSSEEKVVRRLCRAKCMEERRSRFNEMKETSEANFTTLILTPTKQAKSCNAYLPVCMAA